MTTDTLVLAGKTVRDHRRGTLGWTLGLYALVAIQLAVFPSIREQAQQLQQFIEAYPEALKALFGLGDDYSSGPGFLGAEAFSFLAPLMLIGLGIGQAAAALAGEEEHGTVDVLLSLPITRTRVVLEKAAAIGATLVVAGVGLVLTVVALGALVDLDVGFAPLVTATVSVVLVSAAASAIALAVGCATGRRALAIGVATALVIGGYLVDGLARLTPSLRGWDRLALFHYYEGGHLTRTAPELGREGVLLLITAVLLALAVVGAERHDLRT